MFYNGVDVFRLKSALDLSDLLLATTVNALDLSYISLAIDMNVSEHARFLPSTSPASLDIIPCVI